MLREANDTLAAVQRRLTAGFVGRELYRGNEDEWWVILRCRDREAMGQLLEAFRTNPTPEMRHLASLIDRSSMRTDFADLISAKV